MRRYMLLTLFVTIVGAQVPRAAADEPSVAEQAQAALAKHRQLSYQLPGYPAYQTAEGIEKLKLTEKQKMAIRDIGLVFNGKVADQRQAAFVEENKAQDLAGDEKQKFLDEYRQREGARIEERRKWALEARRLAEKVLSAEQLELARELDFAQRTSYLIMQPQALSGIKFDAEQEKQIDELHQAVQKRQQELRLEMQKSYTEGSAKLLELLTPEQRTELRKALEEAHDSALQVQ
jgi:hypothetical protein